MNEDRPILSTAKCRPMILVPRIKYVRIFAGFLGERASNDGRVVADGDFIVFTGYLFRNF